MECHGFREAGWSGSWLSPTSNCGIRRIRNSPSNRRISVIVQYLAGDEAKEQDAQEKAATKKAETKPP